MMISMEVESDFSDNSQVTVNENGALQIAQFESHFVSMLLSIQPCYKYLGLCYSAHNAIQV